MVDATETTAAARRGRRPERIARITVAWTVVYAGFGLACALSGTPPLRLGGAVGPPVLGWAVVAVAAMAAGLCRAVSGRAPRRVPLTGWWVVCALLGIAAFGLLMDVVTLVFGQGVDSWAAAANHALAATGAVLLAATARSARPAGPASDADRAPAPSAASRPVRLAAWGGTLAFVPYAAMKVLWVTGGTFAGVSGEEMLAASERNGASDLWLTLESWGVDGTVLLAALGVLLLWGLVRPWGQVFPRWTPWVRGRRVPRWLLLGPALVGAATLAPYGVIGMGYTTLATAGVVTMRRGDFPSTGDALTVGWIGMVAFAGYGLALVLAARSYWTRTRPVRRERPGGESSHRRGDGVLLS